MAKIAAFLRNNLVPTIALSLILLIGLYCYYKKNRVEFSGIFTIARVDHYASAADGSDTDLTILLGNKEYHTTVGTGSMSMVGKYFFAKVLLDDPTYEVILCDNVEVPGCILSLLSLRSLPQDGWAQIPVCR